MTIVFIICIAYLALYKKLFVDSKENGERCEKQSSGVSK